MKQKHTVENLLETYKFRDALYTMIDLARKGNKYLQDKEPWKKAGKESTTPEDQEKIDNCLFLCLQLTANLSICHQSLSSCHGKKIITYDESGGENAGLGKCRKN